MDNQQESLQLKILLEGLDINLISIHKTEFKHENEKLEFVKSMSLMTIDEQCLYFNLGRHVIKGIRNNLYSYYMSMDNPCGFERIPINSKKIYLINRDGIVIEKDTRSLISYSIDYKGYKRSNVTYLKNTGTLAKYERTHRLVGLTFIENKNNLPFINHIDGNKLNNHYLNLEWCTAKENSKHAVKNGLKNSKKITGSLNYKAKLTEEQVKEILMSSLTPKQVSEIYKISYSVASKILNKKAWKHVRL